MNINNDNNNNTLLLDDTEQDDIHSGMNDKDTDGNNEDDCFDGNCRFIFQSSWLRLSFTFFIRGTSDHSTPELGLFTTAV